MVIKSSLLCGFIKTWVVLPKQATYPCFALVILYSKISLAAGELIKVVSIIAVSPYSNIRLKLTCKSTKGTANPCS